MKISNDLITNHNQMKLIEKYEKVINYLYPIAQNIPRKHGIVKKYLKNNENDKLTRFLASWHGHIQWGNSHNLKNYIDNMINKTKYPKYEIYY